jgi:hypothetical protein
MVRLGGSLAVPDLELGQRFAAEVSAEAAPSVEKDVFRDEFDGTVAH